MSKLEFVTTTIQLCKIKYATAIILLLFCLSSFVYAEESPREKCDSPYKDKHLTQQEISNVIESNFLFLAEAYKEGSFISALTLLKWGKNEWYEKLEKYNLPKPTDGLPAREANLCFAILRGANFRGADLKHANFQGSNLVDTNFKGAILDYANFDGAVMTFANFKSASLHRASFKDAVLVRSFFKDTGMVGTNFQNANLEDATIENSYLSDASLTGANLNGVSLTHSSLNGTDIKDATFLNTDLTDVLYLPSSAPAIGSTTNIKGLLTVRLTLDHKHTPGKKYKDPAMRSNLSSLIMLRNTLKAGGNRYLERQVTYVIEKWKTENQASPTEKWLRKIFFEYTVGYGLYFNRPLIIIISLVFVFAPFYIAPLASKPNVGSDIIRVWPKDNKEEVLTATTDLKILGYAFYFSLLSAFHIGWRDLNVGAWITRLQPRVYTLQAKGWVRTVSGIQSLISVYLLAMWVLTYFGRPFE